MSLMLYGNNNIWRATSGCALQHKAGSLANELRPAHALRFLFDSDARV